MKSLEEEGKSEHKPGMVGLAMTVVAATVTVVVNGPIVEVVLATGEVYLTQEQALTYRVPLPQAAAA